MYLVVYRLLQNTVRQLTKSTKVRNPATMGSLNANTGLNYGESEEEQEQEDLNNIRSNNSIGI